MYTHTYTNTHTHRYVNPPQKNNAAAHRSKNAYVSKPHAKRAEHEKKGKYYIKTPV
jgi:hypothetical protein